MYHHHLDLSIIDEPWVADLANSLALRNIAFHKKQEEIDLLTTAEKQAKILFTKQMLLKQYTEDLYNDEQTPIPVPPRIKETVLNNTRKKPRNILLTINPRPDVSLDELKKVVNKFLSKKSITHYIYCYEVRKETEENVFQGLHVHILFTYTSRVNDIKNSAKRITKKICDSENPSILNIKFIQDELIPEKIKYLRGEKKTSKKAGVLATKKYRKICDLKDLYESEALFPCKGPNEVIIAD